MEFLAKDGPTRRALSFAVKMVNEQFMAQLLEKNAGKHIIQSTMIFSIQSETVYVTQCQRLWNVNSHLEDIRGFDWFTPYGYRW